MIIPYYPDFKRRISDGRRNNVVAIRYRAKRPSIYDKLSIRNTYIPYYWSPYTNRMTYHLPEVTIRGKKPQWIKEIEEKLKQTEKENLLNGLKSENSMATSNSDAVSYRMQNLDERDISALAIVGDIYGEMGKITGNRILSIMGQLYSMPKIINDAQNVINNGKTKDIINLATDLPIYGQKTLCDQINKVSIANDINSVIEENNSSSRINKFKEDDRTKTIKEELNKPRKIKLMGGYVAPNKRHLLLRGHTPSPNYIF